MTRSTNFPPVTCSRHTPPVFLVDVVGDDGITQECPVCLAGQLTFQDVVRQLYVRVALSAREPRGA